ncbi:hypothetical protein [Asticcacaulis sp. AC402]|uniref:hypothetical protein n=1 Tax=Asticcacaulis sp. AC402 TaxID=1282361 RepID=UPI0003C3CC39|nr:hypothetical protein [Asticcacaulis sp. AC402]ESQ73923.1 hypothetical protein ABAC402_16880 [Asticcacaulis sp. AC402]
MKKFATTVLMFALAGCGPQSGEQFGIYADGENHITVSHATSRIVYAADGTSGEALLKQAEAGQGLSFTTWRNKVSCGITDSSGNVFAVPRGDRFDKDNAIFTVEKDSPELAKANAGQTIAGLAGSRVVTLRTDNLVRIRYLYDDASGIRWIDQYNPQGELDRRIWLERGVGFLAHCRGFSVDDYRD